MNIRPLGFLSRVALACMLAITAVSTLTLTPQPAQAQAFSDYAENKLADYIFRAQTFTAPSTIYVGLGTAACSDSSFGTEVSGGSYARVAVTSSLANWSGTQSAGSTSASSGTGGQISNNNTISFPTPSAGWGTVTHWFLADASTSGNLLICAALTTSKTINSGDTVSFAAGSLTITLQ
jgi:hypothetical protein